MKRFIQARGAEEVDVVGHDHVFADEPMVAFGPPVDEKRMASGIGQKRLAVFRADGDEYDDGPVVFSHGSVVDGAAAPGVVRCELHARMMRKGAWNANVF